MRDFLNLTKALADENRVRLLLALRGGELCACQLTELLQLAPSTVSKHLSILRHAGLVEARKEGRWMHYRLVRDGEAPPEALEAVAWALAAMKAEPAAHDDAKRIKAILKIEPEALCASQRQGVACCSSAPETRAAARWRKDGPAASTPKRSKPSRPARARKP